MTRLGRRLGLVWGLALTVTAGCATVQAPPPLPVPIPPPARTLAPLPELPVAQIEDAPAQVAPRPLFTLGVRDTDVRDVLLALGKQTGLNIVAPAEVKGTVTVDLNRVTLEEALDVLLTPLGLVYQREGNFIRISRPVIETRIFTLNYISAARTGSAALGATAGGGGGGGGAGGGGGGASGAASSVASAESMDLWAELDKTLATFLSPTGKAVLSRMTGLVAVTDFPANLHKIARYLELAEGSAQRQVVIQAQIIEVALSTEFSSGVDWSLLPLIPSGTGTKFRDLPGKKTVTQRLAPASSPLEVGFVTKLPSLLPGMGGWTIEMLVKALATQGQVTVLSRPQVSTLNNQKAVMKVAVDDVFFTVTRTREPTTGVVTETVVPQTVTQGIVLDVTPQIAADDTITMNIRPSISERVGQATSPQGSTVPIMAVRATDTVVRVRDGETVLIAGLMKTRSSRNLSGVPWLQDLPVVGAIFRQQKDEDSKTELIILLTPTVLIGRRHAELTARELESLQELRRARPAR